MVQLTQNARIRLNILLIALLGGLGFLGYLLVNVFLAQRNGERLDDLLGHHYPVIEQIRLLKQDAHAVRERHTAAVGLEDGFLLEDAQETAADFRQRLLALRELEPSLGRVLLDLGADFNRYYDQSRELALALIENQEGLGLYQGRILAVQESFVRLSQQMDALQVERQQQYEVLLLQTNAAVRQANQLGAVLGALVIVGLGVLAWTISVRVLVQVNRSDRLKNEFLTTISHELRTPMNGVVGALNLLRSGSLSGEQIGWVAVAMRAATAMMVSIDDILQFSELVSGQARRQPSRLDLRAGLERLLESWRPEFEARHMPLSGRWLGDWPALVDADGPKILHVVRQLLSNALKFGEGGAVQVEVEIGAVDAAGRRWVCLWVRDAGPGIAPAQLQELFRPFRQLDGAFNRRHQGMGIGLALCRATALLLEGSVRLTNRREGGIEAEFCFPVMPVAVETAVPAAPVPMPVAAGTLPCVLLAEDNPVNQMVLKGYLHRLGCRVLTADNGQEALTLVQQYPVQLVLMDCQMPVMDGFEATRRIRQLASPLGLMPILAVTANVLDSDRQRCLEAGMNDHLKKPLTLETLRAALAPYLPVSVPVAAAG